MLKLPLERNLLPGLLLAIACWTFLAGKADAQTTETNDGAKGAASNNSTYTAGAPQRDDYVIGIDDVLAINVWKETDLSRSVIVRPDGKITLPLAGEIEASGLTPRQLQDKLTKDLENYISKPVVTVIVQEARSQKFNIVGEIQKPGAYVLTNTVTVLDAIALAGGLREWAKAGSIYVLRKRSDGGVQKIPFNYKKVIKGDHPEQNIRLQAKDTVVVP